MLIFFLLGKRFASMTSSPGEDTPVSSLDGAVFGLFTLLVAFTFSGAAGRFDTHRMMSGQEANDIGTAYLRIEMLSKSAQPEMRELFRNYLDSRLATAKKFPDIEAIRLEMAHSAKLQNQIWSRAVAATREEGSHPNSAILLLPALNQMIDITTTRMMLGQTHPPFAILGLLFALGLASAFLIGMRMPAAMKRGWVHVIGYMGITAITIFLIVDLEYPRFGFIQVNAYDKVLIDLRQSMNAHN